MSALEPVFKFLSDFVMQNEYPATRKDLFQRTEKCKIGLHDALGGILKDPSIADDLAKTLGLNPQLDYKIARLRISLKVSPGGDLRPQIIVAVTQESDLEGSSVPFRGGATLIVDLRQSIIRYCVTKNISSDERKNRQLKYANQLAGASQDFSREPFALLHAIKKDRK